MPMDYGLGGRSYSTAASPLLLICSPVVGQFETRNAPAQVVAGIRDQLVKDPHGLHLFVPAFRIGRLALSSSQAAALNR